MVAFCKNATDKDNRETSCNKSRHEIDFVENLELLLYVSNEERFLLYTY